MTYDACYQAAKTWATGQPTGSVLARVGAIEARRAAVLKRAGSPDDDWLSPREMRAFTRTVKLGVIRAGLETVLTARAMAS